MKKYYNLNNFILLVLSFAIAFGLAMVVITSIQDDPLRLQQTQSIRIIPEVNHVYRETDTYAGEQLVYTFDIPKDVIPGTDLMFYVKHQFVQLYINNVPMFIMDEPEGSHTIITPGSYWVSVDLQSWHAGETVTVVADPVYKRSAFLEFMISDRSAEMAEVRRDELPITMLSIAAFELGIIIGLGALVIGFGPKEKVSLLYLGALTTLTGLWKGMGISFIHDWDSHFFFDPQQCYVIGMVAYILIPFFGIQFMNKSTTGRGYLIGQICAAVAGVTAIVLFVLQITGLMEMHSALSFLSLENAVFLAIVSVDLVRRNTKNLWLITFPAGAALDLIILWMTGSSRMAVFFTFSILINAVIRAGMFIQNAIKHEGELKEAKATTLMNQIRPHFIHNTLTSIYYLCETDPLKAQEVVKNFNSYLHTNFTSINKQTPVPFTEELEHAKAYLAVEKTRFEEKLQIEFDTKHTSFRLPALTLQPLVENAVKHGMKATTEPLHIRVSTSEAPNGSLITVEDDGPGFKPTEKEESDRVHVGIENIRQRLELMCRGTIEISSRSEGGTTVSIFIPDQN